MAGPGGIIKLTVGDDVFPGPGDSNSGDEIVYGLAGDDWIDGGLGKDALYGGDGNDQITDILKWFTIIDGGSGDDVVSIRRDTFSADGDGYGSLLSGGGGTDRLIGTGSLDLSRFDISGFEIFEANSKGFSPSVINITATAAQFESFDTIIFNAANPTVRVGLALASIGSAPQTLDLSEELNSGGGPRGVLLYGSHNGDTVTGCDGDDEFYGDGGDDVVYGGIGDDWFYGGIGNDTLFGGDGNDFFDLDLGGADTFNGGAGDDTIYATKSSNIHLMSMTSVETLLIGRAFSYPDPDPGPPTITGTLAQFDAFDTISRIPYQNDSVQLAVFATGSAQTADLSDELQSTPLLLFGSDYEENLTLRSGKVYGNGGNDTLTGGDDGTLYGGAGDDILSGSGDYILHGGDGNDTLTGRSNGVIASYAGSAAGVTVSLAQAGAQNTIGAGIDTLTQIAGLTGSDFDDTLTGDYRTNWLIGGFGNDALHGGDGYDEIFDEQGASTAIYGGGGNDTIRVALNVVSSGTVSGGAGIDRLKVSFGGSLQSFTLDGLEILDTDLAPVTGKVAQFNSFDSIVCSIGYLFHVELIAAASGSPQTLDLANKPESHGIMFYGSADDETLIGGLHVDGFYGGDGDDTLDGGGGARTDLLYGGNGIDTVSYQTADTGVSVDLNITAWQQDTIGAGYDWLSQFENITGSSYADTLLGDGFNNKISGGLGGDITFGGAGDDAMVGGYGDDRVDGGDGSDALEGNGGSDYLTAGAGDDTAFGQDGDDRMEGGDDADMLYGGSGEDFIKGEAGADLVDGGEGSDRLYGGDGADTIEGREGRDYASGGIENDVIHGGDEAGAGDVWLSGGQGDDTVYGGDGGDRLDGDDGSDSLFGGVGNDYVTGGNGDDVIYGGAGTDSLFGGGDADLFDFNAGSGTDNVYDFADDVDTIQLSSLFGFSSIGQVLAATSVFGNHAYINLGGGNGLIVLNWISTGHVIEQLGDDILIV